MSDKEMYGHPPKCLSPLCKQLVCPTDLGREVETTRFLQPLKAYAVAARRVEPVPTAIFKAHGHEEAIAHGSRQE